MGPIPRDRDNANIHSGSAPALNEALPQESNRNDENVRSYPQTLRSQESGDFRTSMSNEDRPPLMSNGELPEMNPAQAYTDKQKELLSNPLFEHIRT